MKEAFGTGGTHPGRYVQKLFQIDELLNGDVRGGLQAQ